MIDTVTYKQVTPKAFSDLENAVEVYSLSSLNRDGIPLDFYLLLPAHIMGFSMQAKRWGL